MHICHNAKLTSSTSYTLGGSDASFGHDVFGTNASSVTDLTCVLGDDFGECISGCDDLGTIKIVKILE